jgi:hypothetical protein
MGANFLRCTKILSQRYLILSLLHVFIYHVKTHVRMIMMESNIIIVSNKVLLKFRQLLTHYFLWGSKYRVKKDYSKD